MQDTLPTRVFWRLHITWEVNQILTYPSSKKESFSEPPAFLMIWIDSMLSLPCMHQKYKLQRLGINCTENPIEITDWSRYVAQSQA